jgi:hypothetical protein
VSPVGVWRRRHYKSGAVTYGFNIWFDGAYYQAGLSTDIASAIWQHEGTTLWEASDTPRTFVSEPDPTIRNTIYEVDAMTGAAGAAGAIGTIKVTDMSYTLTAPAMNTTMAIQFNLFPTGDPPEGPYIWGVNLEWEVTFTNSHDYVPASYRTGLTTSGTGIRTADLPSLPAFPWWLRLIAPTDLTSFAYTGELWTRDPADGGSPYLTYDFTGHE